MVQSHPPIGTLLASYLSNNGRRARHSNEAVLPYSNNSIDNAARKALEKQRMTQAIAARTTTPHSGGLLKAPNAERGWTWEDIEGASEGSITKPHEARSFQKRFPAGINKTETCVHAEAPSGYVEQQVDFTAEKATHKQEIPCLDAAVLINAGQAQPTKLDAMLRHKRQGPSRQSVGAFGGAQGEKKADGQGLNTPLETTDKAEQAQDTEKKRVEKEQPSQDFTKTFLGFSVRSALSRFRGLGEEILSFSQKIYRPVGSLGLRPATVWGRVVKAKFLFVGASMKKHDSIENSLLELDTGPEAQALQQEKIDLNNDELKQLKKSQVDSNTVDETVNQNHGVVGAVKLTPASPLPRADKDRAVVFNPVVHGKSGADKTDYHMSITHEAPKLDRQRQSVLGVVGVRTRSGGIIFGTLLALVSLAIILLLGFIGYAALTGNAPNTVDIATDTNLPHSTEVQLEEQLPAVMAQPAVSAVEGLSVGEVKELESMLAQLGIATGSVDGFADDATRIAVQEFEGIMGYPATDGRLTKFLQGEIRGVTFERFGFQ